MQAKSQTIGNEASHQKNSRPTLSSARAIAKANGYLSKYVGVLFGAADPRFFPFAQPIWQVSVTFKMHEIGPFIVGLLDVDAVTGEVLPLSAQQIRLLQERTDADLTNRTLSPTTAG